MALVLGRPFWTMWESERGAVVVVCRDPHHRPPAGHTLGAAPDVVKTTSSHAENHWMWPLPGLDTGLVAGYRGLNSPCGWILDLGFSFVRAIS